MDIPGATEAMNDPHLREKAEKQAERLLEELKKNVQAETKDVGVLRKELRITVPAQVINDHVAHNYDELMQDAVVPGFRKGRAPRQLVEKRFGAEVRESLKTSILGQSFFAVAEKEKLEVLGDPLFQIKVGDGVKLMDLGEAMEHIHLPENGDFSYTCEIEIKPAFELPELKGIEIKSPEIEITAEQVNEYIDRQCKIRGRYEPRTEGATEKDDLLIADVTLLSGDQVVKREDNVQLGIRPTRLDGIPLMTLDQVLDGAKPGDKRNVDCTIPDDYERTDLRGKPGRFEFQIHEVKRQVPIAPESLAEQLGLADVKTLREEVRAELESEKDRLIERAKKEQILQYLLEKIPLELPTDLSARQTDRAVMRRVIDLQQNGLPWSDIEARIDELRTSAKEDVARDLKLEFILEKVAKQLEVGVTDEEVNTEIARIARRYNRRFDRIRDDLERRGLMPQLAEQIRQDKCVHLLLQDAKIVAVKPDAEEKPK